MSSGKLRRSDRQHTVSSSLTPQPPRSQSFSHHTGGTAESAEYLATGSSISGALYMPGHAGRRQSTRTSLFAGSGSADAGSVGTQYESFSSEQLSPPAALGSGARHLGGFNTPQRRAPAQLVGASPRRGGVWSPGAAHHGALHTMPTIGSEDSWDQNAQGTPSPARAGVAGAGNVGDMGTPYRGRAQQYQQQQVAGMPVQALPRLGGLDGPWAASPVRANRGMAPTPRSVSRLPPAAAAGPRGQQGLRTPGFYARRTGNFIVSGANLEEAGGEGDTVTGVLQLLGGTDAGDSTLQPAHSGAHSSFSSSSSLAGTPDASYMQQGNYQGGYFTPARPNRGVAAALLPASARPASRTAVWAATPAVSGRNIPPGMSGSGFVAVSAAGHAGAAAAGQQQVPDTPLLKAGRNIAGAMFSPAPPMPLSMQQQQRVMSTPSHIQSLLPPPGSASKLKPAAAMLASAAVTGTATHPAGSSASLSTPAGAQLSSAAAAAALLQPSPAGASSSSSPVDANAGPAASAPISSSSSCFNTLPNLLQPGPLSEDMHTPVQSPRARSPVGTPDGGATSESVFGKGSSGFDSGSRLPSSPPPAPARPVPGVVLVPALEAAESLYGSEEYLGDDYISEGYEGGEFEDGDGYGI